MRFSISAVAATAAFVVCVRGADLSDLPGYEALPEPTTNKYDAPDATEDLTQATIVARSVEEPKDDYIPDYIVGDFEPTHMPEEDLHPTLHARSADNDESEPADISAGYFDEAGNLHVRSIEEPETYDWDDGELTEEEYQHLQTRGIEADVAPSWQDDFEAGRISDEYFDEEGTLHKRSLDDDFEAAANGPSYYDEEGTLHKRSSDDDTEDLTANDISPHYFDEEGNLHKRSEDDQDEYSDPAHPGHDADFQKRSLDDEDEAFDEPEAIEESEVPLKEDETVSSEPATPAAGPTPKPTSADTVSKAASTTTTTTTGSQWSDVVSETAGAAGLDKARTALFARGAVPSHPRHRPQHHSYRTTGTGTTTASATTTRKGFFKMPW